MNFHKTIGFLAALLLMVGLGAPDSFAQDVPGTMTVTFNETSADAEAEGTTNPDSVKVRVTLNPAPDAALTVTVALSVTSNATTGPYSITEMDLLTARASVDVVVDESGTGESAAGVFVARTVTDADDPPFYGLARLNANAPEQTGVQAGTSTYSYATYTASIPIKDVQRTPSSSKSITLEVRGDPIPSLNANDAGTQEVPLTVTLAQAPGAVDGTNVTVTVNISGILVATNGSETVITATAVTVEGDETTEATPSAAITLPTNSGEGTLIVYAGADGYRTDEIEIPVIGRSAEDVQGFRVVIASPGHEDWVGIGDEVEVHVMRVSRHAYDWTRFTSIAVSLSDTTDADAAEGHQPTFLSAFFVDDTNQNAGDPTIAPSVTVENLNAARDGTIETNNEDVSYDRATDKLVFKIELMEDEKSTVSADDFKGVYAAAIFMSAGDGTTALLDTLNSNDTKKNVFTSMSLLNGVPQANRKVGDGKLIQVDVVRPADSDEFDASSLTVNVNGDPATRTTKVKIGDEIEAELAVSGSVRFRDENIRLAIIPVDAAAANGRDKTFASATYDADDISDASGRSLGISLDVAAGTFKLQARTGAVNQRGFNRDTGKRLKASDMFEVDGLPIVARINTIDQAGNVSATGVSSVAFTGDSRKPKISVIHPAAGDHFSAIYENTRDLEDYDEFLMPLVVRVDEDGLDSLYVFAKGADAYADRVNLNSSISDRVGAASANTVGDTLAYNTSALVYPEDLAEDADERMKLIGGAGITLMVVAKDASGNVTEEAIAATHDENPPKITAWFPKRSLLEAEDDGSYLINATTRHPTLTLPEAVDSISVSYESRGDAPVVETVSGMRAKGDRAITITTDLMDGRTYTLRIFTRDLAGNVAISGEEELTFSSSFANPMANAFKVTNKTQKIGKNASTGVIAGQAFVLEIMAIDGSGAKDRNVYTYKNDMASEVRISASSPSVRFSGGGVADNGDGTATLDADGWNLGKRMVHAKSEMAIDATTITVQHLDAADAEVFNGSIGGLYVDAADFDEFKVTAMQGGVEVDDLNPGAFDLTIVPTDEFGNASTKAFTKPLNAALTVQDSLNLLDNRVSINATKNSTVEFDTIPVDFRSLPAYDDLSLGWDFSKDGDTFSLNAPADRTRVTITISIVDDDLEPSNERTADIRTQRENFSIVAPLMPMLTLWGPNGEDWTNETEITVPADAAEGSMITVLAQGYKDGSTVTFSDGTEATADSDGNASLMLPFEAGTVTVSATAMISGRTVDAPEMTWTFVDEPDEPMRMAHWADAEMTDPVYLVYDPETGPSDYTVGSDDLMAIIAVYNQSADANIQADTNDDGMIDQADLLNVLGSWGKTDINAPASKPIVLLPGVNENAEFSISLGSERVVAGELVAVDVSLANVQALIGYGFALNYDATKFEFVSVAPADEDLLKSTGGETVFHHIVADGQIEVATGMYNGTAISGGGDAVRFVFRVLYEFEDNARFEIANGLVFDPSQLQNPAVVAGVLELQSTPREFALHQNFPNPFNPDTTIKYDLAESADITLQIYNVLGQVVRTLVASEAQNAGRYQIRWNGMDDRGVPVSSGVYFYQISAEGKFQQVQKLMLLK